MELLNREQSYIMTRRIGFGENEKLPGMSGHLMESEKMLDALEGHVCGDESQTIQAFFTSKRLFIAKTFGEDKKGYTVEYYPYKNFVNIAVVIKDEIHKEVLVEHKRGTIHFILESNDDGQIFLALEIAQENMF